MKISYCTTCHGRLWQLKQTIEHNLQYTSNDSSEIVVLFYNDEKAYREFKQDYHRYIQSGVLTVINHIEDRVFKDGKRWSWGYTKDLVHTAAKGQVLFNLDADNFIDDGLHELLLTLKEDEVVITKQSEWSPDGRSGRIGLHKSVYAETRYGDDGNRDDIELMMKCVQKRLKFRQVSCQIKPISNIPT